MVVLRRKCRREPQLDADEREYAERRDGQKHSTPADQREKSCRNNDGEKRTDGVGTVHPSCGSGTLLRDAPLGNELYCSCRKHALRETEEKANNQKRPERPGKGSEPVKTLHATNPIRAIRTAPYRSASSPPGSWASVYAMKNVEMINPRWE